MSSNISKNCSLDLLFLSWNLFQEFDASELLALDLHTVIYLKHNPNLRTVKFPNKREAFDNVDFEVDPHFQVQLEEAKRKAAVFVEEIEMEDQQENQQQQQQQQKQVPRRREREDGNTSGEDD